MTTVHRIQLDLIDVDRGLFSLTKEVLLSFLEETRDKGVALIDKSVLIAETIQETEKDTDG